jgi:hypothetical protein
VRARAAYPDGDVLQAEGDDKLHVVEAGRRRWIADSGSIWLANPDLGRLHRVSFEELDGIPVGAPYHQWPLLRDAASGRMYLLVQETGWRAPRRRWVYDQEAFTRLGFQWGDVAAGWPDQPAAYADAPALTYRPVSRDLTTFTTAAGRFSTVPAWRLQVEDERLHTALVLAATFNAEWRDQIAPRLAPLGTWMEWGDLPPGAAGMHNHGLNRITMSRRFEGESFGVLAAVLVHEVFHAATEHVPDAAACFAEEAEAFAWAASTWASLPPPWRSRSAAGDWLDGLVEAWHAQRLQQLVTESEAYQQQCGHVLVMPGLPLESGRRSRT